MKTIKNLFNLLVMFVMLLGMLPLQHTQATTDADTWKVMASMPTARTLLGAVTASNGKIYAIGGGTKLGVLATVEEYDPATNTWATRASMPTARQDPVAVAASNGKIYAIGGRIINDLSSALNTVEEYDPATDTWATRASMPTARAYLGVTAASNGKIYAIGGGNGTGALSTVEEYDPAINTWATRASMPTARYGLGVATAGNGKIYAFGGEGHSTVEEYDPATDTWTTKANMSIARWNMGVAALNGKIYVVGGQISGSAMAEYDPATDTWAIKADMLLGERLCSGVTASNGKIYAIGGHNEIDVVATVEEYTPMQTTTYSISGQVTLSGASTGIAGVTVSAGSGFSASTDASGNYIINAIPAGSYTLTPSLNGYSFNPSTRPVLIGPNATGQDFSATPIVSNYSISGRVTAIADSSTMEGVMISDGIGHTATTGVDGTFTLGGLAAGTYTLTPTKPGFYFDPINRNVVIGPDTSGQDFTGITTDAGSWRVMASMPTARNLLGAATASNGKIYAIGGGTKSGVLATVEEYDPATNTWATRTSMPTARQDPGVVAANNGKLYAIGGRTNNSFSSALNTVEEYNPVTDTWATRASMPTARGDFGVTVASNGKIYAIGGGNGTGALSTVEEYDPATNTWSTRASMPTARFALRVAAADNGKIYAIGGDGHSTVEEYNPATDTWATKANMSLARWNIGITAFNGKIYIVGGQYLGPAMAEYDPVTDTWATKADMLLGERHCPGVAVSNGKIYAIGGNNEIDVVATVEEYTPVQTIAYSISGQVTLSGTSTGIAGVSISAGSGFSASTDASGNYIINAIPAGSYTLTPSLIGYSFSPSTRPVLIGANTTEQDFSATPIVSSYSISGRVTAIADTSAMEGVVISDGIGHTATTGVDGTFTLGGLAAGTYTLTPTKPGFYFDPIIRNVVIGPDTSGQDFTGITDETIILKADPGYNSIHISWEPAKSTAVTNYRVQRATPTALSTYEVITTTSGLDYFDLAGLTKDQTYCYKVDAMASGSIVASSSAACAVFGQINLWIPDMYGVNGDDNVIVPINIRNATGLTIASADIWIQYDPAVLNCTNVTNTPMSIEFQWEFNCSTPGLVKISTFASPPKAVMGDGSLFWLTFKVLGDAGSTSAVTLKPFVTAVGGSSIYTDPGDGTPIEVSLSLTSGIFNVESTGKLGDVTNDSIVNSADAYLALQISVGKVAPTFKQKFAADVNGDGTINSADVSMILYFAANGDWPIPPTTTSAYPSAARTANLTNVSLDSVRANPGGTATTTLRVENLQDWAGGDFVITFDPRLVVNVTNVTSAGLAISSPLQYQYSGDGSLKISIARSASVSGTGALATITLKLAANAVIDTSPFILAGVRFHDPYGRDFVLSAIQGTINRQNGNLDMNYTVFLPFITR